jgi:class 3 adenylate cyclase
MVCGRAKGARSPTVEITTGGARVKPAGGWTMLADPVSEATAAVLFQLFGALMGIAGVGGVIAWLAARDQAAHSGLLLAISTFAIVSGCGLVAAGAVARRLVHRWFEPLALGLLLIASIAVAIGQLAIGPLSVAVVVLYVVVPIFSVFLLRARYAALIIVLVDVQFGLVVWLQEGYAFPGVQLTFFVLTLGSIGVIVGGLLHNGVRDRNRLVGLRRFLSETVADAILTSGSEPLTEAHRRKIGVLFCDLRGFTRFSSTTEPEEVVEVLGEYFEVVGKLLHDHGATVGMFAGDGILAYIGDPIPHQAPAEAIVRLALDIRAPLRDLTAVWERRGFHLGYGIGVSFGYATLGVMGFEGRYDYTAVGPVVNLAARLSDEAANGEVLIDERCMQALQHDLDATPCALRLKGFDEPMHAHRVTSGSSGDNVRLFPVRSHGA